MDQYRDAPIERFGKWWVSPEGAAARRTAIFTVVTMIGLFAFSFWMIGTPEGQAFNNWVLS